ncbi:hypothetical protein G6F61_014753 [Rhizopus arrhizus]|nr:hypothetical protein G6F61_014753 [Rhizopus arrhizus]
MATGRFNELRHDGVRGERRPARGGSLHRLVREAGPMGREPRVRRPGGQQPGAAGLVCRDGAGVPADERAAGQ